MQIDDRVILLGDIHGHPGYVTRAAEQAKRRGIKYIIQVGDYLCYNERASKVIEDSLELNDVTLIFIPGNHENWAFLTPLGNDPVKISPHVFYMPKCSELNIGDMRTLCLGGAVSVDKNDRRENIDWFQAEEITMGDAMRTRELGWFDIVLTHDCPANVNMPPGCLVPEEMAVKWFGMERLEAAYGHRQMLEFALGRANYELLVHGHYHHGYMQYHDDAKVVGLGCEDKPNTMAILSTQMCTTDVFFI